MWEKIKTGLLMALILLSFQLTSMFWMRVGNQVSLSVISPRPSMPVGETTPASYLDLYAPLHIYVHDADSHYQLRSIDSQFSWVWEDLKSALSQAGGPSGEDVFAPVGLSVWQQAARDSLELRFSGQVELNYWWLAANKSSFFSFDENPLFFDRMLIPSQGNVIYFRNLQANQFWRWQWSDLDNGSLLPSMEQLTFRSDQQLRAVQVPEGVAVAPQAGLYVPERLKALPEILAAPPFRTADKSGIIRQFFSITPRMPRTDTYEDGEVVESFITARQQVLSLSNSGRLEYTETMTQPGVELRTITEQFEQAFGFIDSHGGWPRSVLSDGIRKVTSGGQAGYEFNFVQLYEGYPLVDISPANLSVQVAPDGIKGYLRKTYRILQNGYFPYDIRPAENALQAAAPQLSGRQVTDIYLGYYQRDFSAINPEAPFDIEQMFLFPVWVIELNNGQHVLVHAFKLVNDPGVIVAE